MLANLTTNSIVSIMGNSYHSYLKSNGESWHVLPLIIHKFWDKKPKGVVKTTTDVTLEGKELCLLSFVTDFGLFAKISLCCK